MLGIPFGHEVEVKVEVDALTRQSR